MNKIDSHSEFEEISQRFCGRVVSSVWFSDYSVLYLEFGKIIDSRPNHPKHEQGLFAGYDWKLRLADGATIYRLDRHDQFVESQLTGQSVLSINLTPEQELLVTFDDGSQLESMSDSDTSPDWCFRDGSRYISIKDGRFHIEC